MTKKWYTTTTTVGLPGLADNEVLASQTAPVSGSLTATIAVSATETGFAWVSPSGEPNEASWPTASNGNSDYHVSINVSSIGSSLSLTAGNIPYFPDDLSLQYGFANGTFTSTTGTGVKTTTISFAFGASPGSTDRIGGTVSVNHNGS